MWSPLDKSDRVADKVGTNLSEPELESYDN